jgi:hypothetical protein
VTLNPRWLRIPSAVKYSGLSRSRLYELLGQRRIKSICLKSHNSALRGVRLVDRESVERHFDRELAVSDYLMKEPGTWAGRGAERLELRGPVERSQFVALLQNENPDDG